jgi:hypothetical protein
MLRRISAVVPLLIAGGASLCLLAGVALAAAPSKVTLHLESNPDAAKGHIESTRAACERHRHVKLFFRPRNRWFFVGKDRSDGEGNWALFPNSGHIRSGDYVARISKLELKGGSCEDDTSHVVHWP